jgi:hypothetical protein
MVHIIRGRILLIGGHGRGEGQKELNYYSLFSKKEA